ncbi:hypothetical protein [Streptomyces sp. MMS21 TC-5]|uniref:hypothetical protein n=1 Tax=unclassified Streptomyces TaxID=2593676 RepID=UPI001F60A5C2|nr:hypothetical protein [Streptomyces sp. MMS21 TC-5]MCI4078888.1 hypothetical protein [Streptomyces sp. MMS21 TC-5]
MSVRRWWPAVLVVAAVMPVVVAGVPAQARVGAAASAPVLEKIAPQGAVEVADDKSCFTVTVKGSGFVPGEATRLDVGTDQARGVLRGAPVTVTPDAEGNFGPTTFTPCGVTTHGSTESDFTCTLTHVDLKECREDQVGDVLQKGGRWFSSKVIVWAIANRPDPDA